MQKLLIIAVLVVILWNLGAGLYYMMVDKGTTDRTVKALSWRQSRRPSRKPITPPATSAATAGAARFAIGTATTFSRSTESPGTKIHSPPCSIPDHPAAY